MNKPNELDEEINDGTIEPGGGRLAAEKILATLRVLSQPGDDADPTQMLLATVCMGLEGSIAEQIWEQQATGELDAFVLSLTRFLANHRSEDQRMLLVVEMPRRPGIPAGTRLHLLDEAYEAAQSAESPL